MTPSYNQVQFLETTILSVIGQGYPNLEYIMMDGGSDDGSVEIIERHAASFTYCSIGKDGGQAAAIQQGFERSHGEILAYLNSDDYFLPGALHHVAREYARHGRPHLLIGTCRQIDNEGRCQRPLYGYPQDMGEMLATGMQFGQPACFWSREAFFSVGGLDTSLRCCFDADLFLKLSRLGLPRTTRRSLAVYRRHAAAKSSTLAAVIAAEDAELKRRYNSATSGGVGILSELRHAYLRYLYARISGRLYDLFFETRRFRDELRNRLR